MRDLAAINAGLLGRIDDLVHVLALPQPMVRRGGQLRFGRRGSLVIHTGGPRAGSWHSFESGAGGDLIALVEQVADECFIPLTVGGGLRTKQDVKETLRAGADKVSITTGALERPELVTEGAAAFGSQCIVISVDARRRYDEAGEHYVEVDGESVWFECTKKGGRESTGIDVIEWATEAEERGAGELFVNSIDADGTKDGYDIPLTKAVCDAVSTPVIASSGCGGPEDAYEVFTEAGADAALAASIFHFEEYTIREVKEYLDERGVPVRL